MNVSDHPPVVLASNVIHRGRRYSKIKGLLFHNRYNFKKINHNFKMTTLLNMQGIVFHKVNGVNPPIGATLAKVGRPRVD